VESTKRLVNALPSRSSKGNFLSIYWPCRQSLEEDDEMALQSEVDILSQLDHPNVVKLFEIFDEGDFLYLVMELMIGGEVFPISLKI
jgi:calcium/calmodulin-dependent protein kinase I